MYLCIWVCVGIYIYIYIYIYICVCVCVCTLKHMYIFDYCTIRVFKLEIACSKKR